MLPCAHPSLNPKRHLDWFSRFCTAHGRASLYFTMDRPFPPQNCPFQWRVLNSHLIRDSWAHPSKPTTQTASRLVQPFFAGLTTVTDRPTDRETRSVTIGRIYIVSTAMRPNNSSNAWFIVSTYDVISDLQRRTLMPERVMTRLSARLSSFVCSSLYSVKRLDALSSLHVMGLGSLVFSRDRTVVTLQ